MDRVYVPLFDGSHRHRDFGSFPEFIGVIEIVSILQASDLHESRLKTSQKQLRFNEDFAHAGVGASSVQTLKIICILAAGIEVAAKRYSSLHSTL